MEIPFGYCQCGCGGKPKICVMTSKRMGYISGQPYPYILNHRKRKASPIEDAKPFKIDGVYCRLIPLTQGMHAIVHASRYLELSKHKWHARRCADRPGYYAQRNSYQDANGDRHMIHMHRVVFGIPDEDTNGIDHHNMCGLDNRDENLRYATPEQNGWNRGLQKNNTSGFKGVSWNRDALKWYATIRHNGKANFIGYFSTAYEAHLAWCEAAKRLHGGFARWSRFQ